MHWNQKIDWFTKNYSSGEFSIPAAHFDRKELLKKIETRFINRPKDYYYSNSFNGTFNNWWEYIQSTLDFTLESDPYSFLKSIIDPNKQFWIACEFLTGILIYRAKMNAILELMAISYSWTRTFHTVELKYEYMISVAYNDSGSRIKVTGSKEVEDKIKQAITRR